MVCAATISYIIFFEDFCKEVIKSMPHKHSWIEKHHSSLNKAFVSKKNLIDRK
jgi:hypothetical protein